jgi:hypothetical protein
MLGSTDRVKSTGGYVAAHGAAVGVGFERAVNLLHEAELLHAKLQLRQTKSEA